MSKQDLVSIVEKSPSVLGKIMNFGKKTLDITFLTTGSIVEIVLNPLIIPTNYRRVSNYAGNPDLLGIKWIYAIGTILEVGGAITYAYYKFGRDATTALGIMAVFNLGSEGYEFIRKKSIEEEQSIKN